MSSTGQIGQDSASIKASCPEPDYWTAQQLAAFVNRPVKTIYKWPELYADMPCARIGRAKLFPIERIKRWLERQEQGR